MFANFRERRLVPLTFVLVNSASCKAWFAIIFFQSQVARTRVKIQLLSFEKLSSRLSLVVSLAVNDVFRILLDTACDETAYSISTEFHFFFFFASHKQTSIYVYFLSFPTHLLALIFRKAPWQQIQIVLPTDLVFRWKGYGDEACINVKKKYSLHACLLITGKFATNSTKQTSKYHVRPG